MKITRSFGPVDTSLESASWGARYRVQGEVSKTTVGPLIQAVVTDLCAAPPLVALCDYRGADMGATARRLVVAHKRSGVAATWPTALVVQRDQVEVWNQYAWLQAQHGNLKAVFTELEQAERWSRDMAALQAAQARFRLRG